MKRTFDLIMAAMLLTLTSPLLLLTAAAIRLDSPGPALFRQQRVGSWAVRHSARPGIGLAQDLRIILMTVKQVLTKGGN